MTPFLCMFHHHYTAVLRLVLTICYASELLILIRKYGSRDEMNPHHLDFNFQFNSIIYCLLWVLGLILIEQQWL